ncbi:MAG: substrate-binding domain-containing protein [Clostridiaceae bacterium]|nr:substrate-binding domain-containing protein [Clostridiaceae bacterium]
MGVSIKQIAEIAGVSRGTVDRALNDRPGIKPEVKQHVLEIADQLGYRSNRAGKLLGLHKAPLTIGIQMPSDGNDFFDAILEGQRKAGEELADFGLKLHWRTMKGFSPEKQLQQIDELIELGAQALAIVPIDHAMISDKLAELDERKIPVVTFNTDIGGAKRLCYVGNDYLRSGSTAAGLLGRLADGRNWRILVLTGSVSMLGHNQRIHGFHSTLKEHYSNVKVIDIFETEDDDVQAYNITREFFAPAAAAGGREQMLPADAVYLTAGGTAGCCRAVIEAGLAGRVKIISFDRTPSMEQFLEDRVITASIEQEPYIQGYLPIKLLFDYLLDNTRPPACSWTRNEIVISENMNQSARFTAW